MAHMYHSRQDYVPTERLRSYSTVALPKLTPKVNMAKGAHPSPGGEYQIPLKPCCRFRALIPNNTQDLCISLTQIEEQIVSDT